MPRNGSGTFNRVYDWTDDAANGINIRADRMDTEMDGMATALSDSIARDGQTTIIANLPMSGFKHTDVADATARDDYAAAGQVQDSAFAWCGTSGGTADAQTLSPTPAITAYAAGQKFQFTAGSGLTNTGAMTVAVSGLATKSVKMPDGTDPPAGAITDGTTVEVIYDGTNFILLRHTHLTISATAPSRPYSGQDWWDTTNDLIKKRNGANSDWVTIASWNGSTWIPYRDGTALGTASTQDATNDLTEETDVADDDFIRIRDISAGADRKVEKRFIAAPGNAGSLGPTGGAAEFTGIPGNVARIDIALHNISIDGASDLAIQIGDGGGYESSGYAGRAALLGGSTAGVTMAYQITNGSDASSTVAGVLTLVRVGVGSNIWSIEGTLQDGGSMYLCAGSKELSAALDRVRLITLAGGVNFDAGSVAVFHQ